MSPFTVCQSVNKGWQAFISSAKNPHSRTLGEGDRHWHVLMNKKIIGRKGIKRVNEEPEGRGSVIAATFAL